MLRTIVCCLAVLFTAGLAFGEEPAKPAKPTKEGDKVLSGMSVVGNDEAPKSLVIVPWKSSELGDTLDVSKLLDDEPRPVDRKVFMRGLAYYQIREGSQ